MADTIDDIQRLITAKGLRVERLPGALSATLPTKAYKDSAGRSQLEVRIHVETHHDSLVMDAPWVFDSKKPVSKDAMFSCLLGEVAQSPLVRPLYDAEAGEVRLRVEGLLDRQLDGGVSPGNVVTMLQVLPEFADSVYLRLSAVMGIDAVEPSPQPSPAPAPEPFPERRLADIARRAGGVNRLAALFRMQERLRRERGGEGPARN